MNLHINLLSYRPARRLAKVNQLFMIWGFVGFLGLMATLLAHMQITDHIATLTAQKKQNEETLKSLDKQLGEIKDIQDKRAKVKQRLELIATLSQTRDLSLRLLDALSQAIPEKIWLTKITTKNKSMELQGTSQSNSIVADFMRALAASPNISNVDLTRVASKTTESMDVKEFTITATLDYPEPKPDAANKTKKPQPTTTQPKK